MTARSDISSWTGLTGVEVDQLLNLLKKKGIDWQVVDWQTVGEEAREFGNPYETIWSKLAKEYGISKPITETKLKQEVERAKEEELESQLSDITGVKTLLDRIYSDPNITKKEREQLKERLISGAPELATLIALYDGEERNYAKRFLGEMVISPTPEDVKLLIDKPMFSVLSKRGWVKAIDGVYLKKPMRSTKFAKLIPQCKLVHAEERGEPGTVALYKCIGEKPEEKPTVTLKAPKVVLIPKKPEEKPTGPAEWTRKKWSGEELIEGYKKEYEKIGEKPPTAEELPKRYKKEKPVEVVSVKPHEEVFRVHLPALEPAHPPQPEELTREQQQAIKRVELKPVEEKPVGNIEEIATEYSYADIQKLTKQHHLQTAPKMKMISKLIEIGAL